MAPKLHETYTEMMLARHDYGFPFFEPPSAKLVSPGKSGYVDGQGKWNPIVDLCGDAKNFDNLGLKPPEALPDKAPSDKGIEWGPKYSDKVSGIQIINKTDAQSALALGLPLGVSCAFKMSSSTDSGAILLTEPTIWREGFFHNHEFELWAKQNSEALLKARPEIREHGLWIVKWTYSTKKCSINAWVHQKKDVTVGFSTKACLFFVRDGILLRVFRLPLLGR